MKKEKFNFSSLLNQEKCVNHFKMANKGFET